MAEIVRDDEARQGRKGRPVLWVLIGGMALMLSFMAVYLVWIGSESPDDAGQAASRAAVTGSTSGSSDSNASARVPSANPAYPALDAKKKAD